MFFWKSLRKCSSKSHRATFVKYFATLLKFRSTKRLYSRNISFLIHVNDFLQNLVPNSQLVGVVIKDTLFNKVWTQAPLKFKSFFLSVRDLRWSVKISDNGSGSSIVIGGTSTKLAIFLNYILKRIRKKRNKSMH